MIMTSHHSACRPLHWRHSSSSREQRGLCSWPISSQFPP